MTAPPDRAPPHDLDAEASILGAMILDNECILETLKILRPIDFYRESHRLIFEAITTLHEDARPVDLVLLREELRRRDTLEAVGGPEALIALTDKVPTAANALQYAKVVAETAARRRIIKFGDIVLKMGFAGNSPASVILDKAAEALNRFAAETHQAAPVRKFRTGQEILDSTPEHLDWICESFLSPGLITLFSGLPKAGKSVASYAILGCILSGHPFAEFPTRQAKALVLSEEDDQTIREKVERFGLESVPFLSRRELFPKPAFRELLQQAYRKAEAEGITVVVIDTFSALAGLGPDEEKDSGHVEAAVNIIKEELASKGIAVLLIHHLTKTDKGEGTAARGSGALAGGVDFMVELRRLKDDVASGIWTAFREVTFYGRSEDLPKEPIVLELGAREYTRAGNLREVRLNATETAILQALLDAPIQLTRPELVTATGGNATGFAQAFRSLVDSGRILRTGEGKPRRPYLYGLPARDYTAALPGPVETPAALFPGATEKDDSTDAPLPPSSSKPVPEKAPESPQHAPDLVPLPVDPEPPAEGNGKPPAKPPSQPTKVPREPEPTPVDDIVPEPVGGGLDDLFEEGEGAPAAGDPGDLSWLD